jgi:hypothetical protein
MTLPRRGDVDDEIQEWQTVTLRPISLLISLGVCCTLAIADDVRDETSIHALRTGIEKSQEKLANVEVKSVFKSDSWDDEAKVWKNASEMHSTGWYAAIPGGKARIDVEWETIPWENGPAPSLGRSYVQTYDGRSGETLDRKQGAATDPMTNPRGQIEPKRPQDLNVAASKTGWRYTTAGFFDDKAKPFTLIFDLYESGKVGMTVTRVTRNGRDSLELLQTEKKGSASQVYYFDAKSYALIGYELRIGGTKQVTGFDVEELSEVAPGIWFPQKVTMYNRMNGVQTGRGTWEAISVKVNSPDFSDDLFKIEWPAKTPVLDTATGKYIQMGDAPAQQAKSSPEP